MTSQFSRNFPQFPAIFPQFSRNFSQLDSTPPDRNPPAPVVKKRECPARIAHAMRPRCKLFSATT